MARALIVGAGGIGCELLKNAVLSGLFEEIHLVDLDTIELSNLNRQFLFRRHDIGRFKAQVAREAALKMSTNTEIVAHTTNIMDTKAFPIAFFSKFDLVMNALDNIAARKYVNFMCLAVNVPLIESGTAGFLGQTSLILNRKTECFECVPKEPPKTFPVCTIRSTPSTPVHCIVWAKEFLFANLFGPQVEVENDGNSNDSDLLKSTWRQEQAAFDALRSLKNDPEHFVKALLQKVFVEDINHLRTVEELWTSRPMPTALEIPDQLSTECDDDDEDDHKVWPLPGLIGLLSKACKRLLSRGVGEEITFDKDDADALDFVAAAANLRAASFAIELKSRFDVKAIAGNIIPAIASTNAIAAAMMIVHAANLLNRKEERYCNAFINYGGGRRSVFTREQPCPPNPMCPVCGVDRVVLTCNVAEFKFSDLLENVLPRYPVEFDDEDVSIFEGTRLLYDIDDDAGNSKKTLAQLGVEDSRFLKVDFYGKKALFLAVIDNPEMSGADFALSDFDLDPNRQVPKPSSTDYQAAASASDSSSSNDLEIVESDLEIVSETKRVKTA